MSALLVQSSMLSSNLKVKKNKEICDILIDHVPYLEYSTGDFNKSKEIFKEGEIATNNNLSSLIKLSKTLKKYKQRVHKVPDAKKKILLDTIIFKNISIGNYEVAKERTDIEPHKKYSAKELVAGVNRAIGTRMFSKINYKSFIENNQLGLQLNFFEYSKNQFKGSLHYDTYRGGGIVVNYTGRNILGKSSRLLVTLDIAEQPRARLQYQKIFGTHKNWWFQSEAIGELLIQEVFEDGIKIENIKQNYFQFKNQINKNINSLYSYVGVGIDYELTNLRPRFNPDLVGNFFGLKKYNFNTIEINANYTYNSLNKVFFSTKGTYFKGSVSRSIHNAIYIEPIDENSPSIDGFTNRFSKLNLSFEKRFGFTKKITGILKGTNNFIYEDSLKSDEVSFNEYGYAGKYSLGGYIPNNRSRSYLFAGLHEDELTVNQFMKITLALQLNPINKIYVVPHVNIASVGFTNFDDYIEDAFFPKGDWEDKIETSLLMSAGATFSYNSLLGPVNFDISYINDVNKLRLYFSVGFLFNSSN
jgi:NTE family protein